MRPVLPILLVLVLAFAGCLQLPEDAGTPSATASSPTGPANMTAEESKEESAGVCTDAISLGGDERFCATRTIRVDGDVSNMRRLAVSVQSFNGDVLVEDGREGEWGFVAILQGRGDTAEEAKARLDSIVFSWAHQRGSSHFLDVEATKEGESQGRSAEITVHLPRSILLELAASTTNGDVSALDLRTDGLSLRSTNGDVEARAEVTQVDMGTTNGDAIGELRPTGSGRVRLGSTNGEIDLALHEGEHQGYKIEGATTNGEVEISLRDGTVGPCPKGSEYYTPPCNHRTFETSGFSGRSVQTYVDAGSTNGDVTITSA